MYHACFHAYHHLWCLLSAFITAPFNNMRTVKFKAFKTDKCVFCYHQSNVQRLHPACDYNCRARGNQIVEHSSDNETVVRSREEPLNIWLTVVKRHLSVELWLLESACYWKVLYLAGLFRLFLVIGLLHCGYTVTNWFWFVRLLNNDCYYTVQGQEHLEKMAIVFKFIICNLSYSSLVIAMDPCLFSVF